MQQSHSQRVFERLTRQAAGCTTCPNMIDQSAVLGPANGSINSKILFVAEAPGRFGAGRTGIPFSGDKSGDNFEALIAHIGLTRRDIFITNAVLCNPLENGNNRRPTAQEINNCSSFSGKDTGVGEPKSCRYVGRCRIRRDQPSAGHPLQAGRRHWQTTKNEKFHAPRPVPSQSPRHQLETSAKYSKT